MFVLNEKTGARLFCHLSVDTKGALMKHQTGGVFHTLWCHAQRSEFKKQPTYKEEGRL